jgi:DNA polymerase III delta prime subunit
MFIKRIEKKNKNSDKIYTYYRLMESYRTEDGKPRQKKILDLNGLDLDKEGFKALADRIEDLVYGRISLISIIAKLVRPSSEHFTLKWLRTSSG